MIKARTPWQVTWRVWYALYIRETVTRIMADRFAWFWMIFEPIAFVVIMVGIRLFVLGRDRLIPNAEFVPWLIIGLLGFFLFRELLNRSVGAVEANKGLFAYRQVKPIDPVLVRSALEGVFKTFILGIFIVGGLFLGLGMWGDDMVTFSWAWISLWTLGLGIGLTVSVLSGLVPEIGKVVKMLSLPLLLLSGVILPLSFLPYNLVYYLMFNPIAHGLELSRQAFFDGYRVVPQTSWLYLWYWNLGSILLGLILHLRFEARLKAQ